MSTPTPSISATTRVPATAAAALGDLGCGPRRMIESLLAAVEAVASGHGGEPEPATASTCHALCGPDANPFVHALAAHWAASIAEGWAEPVRSFAAPATVDARGPEVSAGVCGFARHRVRVDAPVLRLLTAREQEVLALVAEGLPNKAVAQRLFLSTRTVEKHVERLLAKTGATNRGQLVVYALRDAGRSRATGVPPTTAHTRSESA